MLAKKSVDEKTRPSRVLTSVEEPRHLLANAISPKSENTQ